MDLAFRLNDRDVRIEVRSDEMLLEVLRRLGVHGCRLACGVGVCGACTALVDGGPVATCLMLAPLAAGRSVRTIEGFDPDHPVVRAFEEATASQCGYCIPAMILTAASLLEEEDRSDEALVHGMAGNLCRCGSYGRIRQAVLAARDELDPSEAGS